MEGAKDVSGHGETTETEVASNIDGAGHPIPLQPAPEGARLVGMTTRSGRRSIPVIAFWRTSEMDTDPTPGILTNAHPGEQCVTSEGNPSASSTKSGKARGCIGRTDLAAAVGGRARVVMADASNRLLTTTSSKKQQEAKLVDAGVSRDAEPVLDWWRNQRFSNAVDGVVREAAQPHQHRGIAPLTPIHTSGFGIRFDSPELKTTGLESGSERTRWTEDQLHSLRLAQADTDPSTADFWGAVANRVTGKEPQQCQRKWFEQIATPQGRLRKGSKRCLSPMQPQMALSGPSQGGDPGDVDDLFQATPMRTGGLVEEQHPRGELEPKTPRTPAGPGVWHDKDSSATKPAADDRYGDKRVVSRAYVQAMSKKVRKGASQSGKGRVVEGMKFSTKAQAGAANRVIHAADVSRGHTLKASVSSTGAVRVASICSCDEDSFGLSDDEESDDE